MVVLVVKPQHAGGRLRLALGEHGLERGTGRTQQAAAAMRAGGNFGRHLPRRRVPAVRLELLDVAVENLHQRMQRIPRRAVLDPQRQIHAEAGKDFAAQFADLRQRVRDGQARAERGPPALHVKQHVMPARAEDVSPVENPRTRIRSSRTATASPYPSTARVRRPSASVPPPPCARVR